jgi:hypothetical protein
MASGGITNLPRTYSASGGGGQDFNINVEYDAISTAATALQIANADIAPRIVTLQGQVATLLTPDGGMWMDFTSPAIAEQYNNFNSQATAIVANMLSFGQLLNQLAQSLSGMDFQTASQIDSAASTSVQPGQAQGTTTPAGP